VGVRVSDTELEYIPEPVSLLVAAIESSLNEVVCMLFPDSDDVLEFVSDLEPTKTLVPDSSDEVEFVSLIVSFEASVLFSDAVAELDSSSVAPPTYVLFSDESMVIAVSLNVDVVTIVPDSDASDEIEVSLSDATLIEIAFSDACADDNESVEDTSIVTAPIEESVAETFGSATDCANSTEETSVERVDKVSLIESLNVTPPPAPVSASSNDIYCIPIRLFQST